MPDSLVRVTNMHEEEERKEKLMEALIKKKQKGDAEQKTDNADLIPAILSS